MNDLKTSMQKNLKALRARNNLKQSEVADLMGVNRATIVNWERNPTVLTIGNIYRLAEVYECEPQDITQIA